MIFNIPIMKTGRQVICFLSMMLLTPVIAFAQQSSNDFDSQGNAKRTKGDLDGAIADYTQAIALDPKSVRAYSDLGYAKVLKGDPDGAIVDFNQSLALEPKFIAAYNERGFAKLHKGDLDGAIADFNQAIALNPKYDNAYYGRGLARQAKGDLDGAIADYNQVIALSPPGGPYPHIYLWLARVQQNQKSEADPELSDFLAKRTGAASKDWPSDVGGFLLDRLSEVDFLTVAASTPSPYWRNRWQCEAFYFVGMKHLLAGDKSAAADNFRKCVATNETILTEYALAQAESQALALALDPSL